MIKKNLAKAIMLGLCISALSTGTAYAQMVTDTTVSVGIETDSDQTKELYDKQSMIDQYIFTDHAKEIADLGITVNYTGVAKNNVEIGISPYSEENAAYFYNAFGKDLVHVVAYDESVIFATSVVDQPAATDTNDVGTIETVTASSADTDQTVESTVQPDAVEPEANSVKEELNSDKAAQEDTVSEAQATDGKVYKGADVQIQVESAQEPAADDQVIYYTTAENVNEDASEAATTSVVDEAVKRDAEATQNGVPASTVILAITAGVMIIGSTSVVIIKKKKVK